MSNEAIKIGFVGAGNTTVNGHIPRFQAIDGVEIAAVANRSRESGQRVAERFDIPRVCDTWVDLMADPDIDAVCIGTWPYMHRTLVLAALESGKHVLVQARMANTAREARDMLDASLKYPHLVTQLVPATSTLKVDRTIRETIAEGYLGDLLTVDLADQAGFMDLEDRHTWRQDRGQFGYNSMALGYWYEAVTRWIGPATSVSAVTRVRVPTRFDDSGAPRFTDVPDQIELVCEMATGALMHMRHGERTVLPPPRQVWLFGSQGTLRLDLDMTTLYGARRGDETLSEIEIPPEKQERWRVEDEFINAIRGIEPVRLNTFEIGVQYMEFTEAVTRSSQQRRTVDLPL